MRYDDNHFAMLQFWVKFGGDDNILRDYRKAKGSNTTQYWCEMWVRIKVPYCRRIEELEGAYADLMPVVVDGQPYLLSDVGCYELEECYGSDWIPSQAEIEAAAWRIRSNWTGDMEAHRAGTVKRIISGPRSSRRDAIAFGVLQRRRLEGDV